MAYGQSTIWDYLASLDPGSQSLGSWNVNNTLNAYQNYGNQLQGAMGGIFATNALNSNNIQNLRNAQAQTAQGFYNAAGTTNAAQSQSNALMEQARQQAAAQQLQAQLQAQALIQQAQLEAEAQKEVARLNAEAQRAAIEGNRNTLLDLERMRQEGNINRINGLLPMLSGIMGGMGGMGGLGGVNTNYGAGVQFQPTTQPSNAQAYRPQPTRYGQGGLLGALQRQPMQRLVA